MNVCEWVGNSKPSESPKNTIPQLYDCVPFRSSGPIHISSFGYAFWRNANQLNVKRNSSVVLSSILFGISGKQAVINHPGENVKTQDGFWLEIQKLY